MPCLYRFAAAFRSHPHEGGGKNGPQEDTNDNRRPDDDNNNKAPATPSPSSRCPFLTPSGFPTCFFWKGLDCRYAELAHDDETGRILAVLFTRRRWTQASIDHLLHTWDAEHNQKTKTTHTKDESGKPSQRTISSPLGSGFLTACDLVLPITKCNPSNWIADLILDARNADEDVDDKTKKNNNKKDETHLSDDEKPPRCSQHFIWTPPNANPTLSRSAFTPFGRHRIKQAARTLTTMRIKASRECDDDDDEVCHEEEEDEHQEAEEEEDDEGSGYEKDSSPYDHSIACVTKKKKIIKKIKRKI